jgi:hypothetical protein
MAAEAGLAETVHPAPPNRRAFRECVYGRGDIGILPLSENAGELTCSAMAAPLFTPPYAALPSSTNVTFRLTL